MADFGFLIRMSVKIYKTTVKYLSSSEIPYGTTITYGELARRSGDIKASRAVGMANSRNPLPILIPCHRVIGSGGKLTGYTGGLNIKIDLLQIKKTLNLSLWPESPNY